MERMKSPPIVPEKPVSALTEAQIAHLAGQRQEQLLRRPAG